MRARLLFALFPYAALACAVVVTFLRHVLSRRSPDVELPKIGDLFGGGLAWRAGLFGLFVGHLFGVAFPRWVLAWNRVPLRLYAIEGAALLAGLLALLGWITVMKRHVAEPPRSALDRLADTIFLTLLFAVITSGLVMAIRYRWGSSWAVVTLTPYFHSLLRGEPDIEFVAGSGQGGLPFVVKVHVFSAFATLAAFPFTRLAALLSLALGRTTDRVLGPVGVWGRSAGTVLRERVIERATMTWIWREEED